ncbi:hypothetical protein ABPG75_013466 [Micractinium tetrahymenae]
MQEALGFRGPSLATARGMLAAAAINAVSREQWERAAAVVACTATAVAVRLREAAWIVLEYLGAMYLSMRYFTGPTCWLLFGYVFWAMPLLRLPLLAYHLYIISPAGRAAVGTSRMPWLARSAPLYWGQLRYFRGSRLVKTAELDPSRRYIWAGHPHGLLGNSYFLAFCTDLLGFSKLFPGIRLSIGVLDLNLRVAFCREICLLHGLCDVDRPTLLARLRRGPGASVFLAVGGAAESLLTLPGCMDLILKRRRGFVRLALESGADLVPVVAFGENECYARTPLVPGSFADRAQRLTKNLCGFMVPRGWGAGILNLRSGPLPLRVPLTVVVGAPLRLPEFKGDLRSEEGRAVVDACHARYCQALQALYDAHKDKYAPDRKQDMRLVE